MLSLAKSDSFLILDLLYLLSSDKSDLLDDESDNDGSDYGSSGTCAFPFCFDNSVGRVSGICFGCFVTIGGKSNYDIVMLVMLVPIVVESKGG